MSLKYCDDSIIRLPEKNMERFIDQKTWVGFFPRSKILVITELAGIIAYYFMWDMQSFHLFDCEENHFRILFLYYFWSSYIRCVTLSRNVYRWGNQNCLKHWWKLKVNLWNNQMLSFPIPHQRHLCKLSLTIFRRMMYKSVLSLESTLFPLIGEISMSVVCN